MQLLELLDANLMPLAINADKILFIGPGNGGGVCVVLDHQTANGPLGLMVSGTHASVVERLKKAEGKLLQFAPNGKGVRD